MRSEGGRERALERVSAAEPSQERSGNLSRQKLSSTQAADTRDALEHSWLSRECTGCGKTTMRYTCVQSAASAVPSQPDHSSATCSLAPSPAVASVAEPVAALLPSPPSPTDWNNRYAMCPVCHRPAAVCLCMRGNAELDLDSFGGDVQYEAAGGDGSSASMNPVPSRHRVSAAETRAAGLRQRASATAEAHAPADSASRGDDDVGMLRSRAFGENSATREWLIPLDRDEWSPARADAVRVSRPLPAAGRPMNALRAAGMSSAAVSTDVQNAESTSRVRAGRGDGTRLTFRVRVPETTSEFSWEDESQREVGSEGAVRGNLLGDLLSQAQRVAQERDGAFAVSHSESGRPGIERSRSENLRSTRDAGELERALDCEAQADQASMNDKERAIQLANKDMALAAAHQEEADSGRSRLEKLEYKIPAEMLCPISSDIMRDPVICTDGHTYERATIAEWVRRRATSPLTNEALAEPVMLIPNHALRSLITSFVDDRGGWSCFA